ncbi:MAG: hydrogenase/urease maturation nickel metallochaperone HypA [Gemmatimonadota bacterium]
MHELALAEGVVATALAAASGRKVRRILIAVGQLQQIDPAFFRECVEQVVPAGEPALAEVRIELRNEAARLRCRACGRDFGLADLADPPGGEELEAIHFVPELAHAYVGCPACGSPDFEVVAGRGIWIDHIEVE